MNVRVNIVAERKGEIKKFLDRFYEKDMKVDNDVSEWMYTYYRPLDVIDLISVLIDNPGKYCLTPWISIDSDFFVKVTDENINMLIKYLLLKNENELYTKFI